MRRATMLASLLALFLSAHCLAGIASGQSGGPGYSPGNAFTFTYSIEPLNYTVRVPKTTSIPLTILTVAPAGGSTYNMTYSHAYKEMADGFPTDKVVNYSVLLKPVVNDSVAIERVNDSTNVLELVFLHNFSTSFSGNITGTNHPVLGNYSIKWKPSGVMEMGIFHVVINITQDGIQHRVLARVLLFEALPGAIPGPSTPLLVAVLVTGGAVMVARLARGRKVQVLEQEG